MLPLLDDFMTKNPLPLTAEERLDQFVQREGIELEWRGVAKPVFDKKESIWEFELVRSSISEEYIIGRYARHLDRRDWLGRPAIAFELKHL